MGLEGSCPISRLVMDAWAEKLEERAEISQELHRINPVKYEPLTIYLLSKYVDDVLTGTETMKLGVTYNKTDRVIEWSRDNESQQQETNPQENTMSILAEVASSIFPCLQFTWDTLSANQSKMMPVLDTQLWVEQEN